MRVLKFSAKFETPFSFADFDIKVMKQFLRKTGGQCARIAKSLVKKGGKGKVSKPYENPFRQSGVTLRSIKGKVSHSGFSVVIAPFKTPKMGKEFYPAATFYGHRAPGRGAGGTRKRRAKNIKYGKVALPRNNYIVEAVKKHEPVFQEEAVLAMRRSISAKTMRMK